MSVPTESSLDQMEIVLFGDIEKINLCRFHMSAANKAMTEENSQKDSLFLSEKCARQRSLLSSAIFCIFSFSKAIKQFIFSSVILTQDWRLSVTLVDKKFQKLTSAFFRMSEALLSMPKLFDGMISADMLPSILLDEFGNAKKSTFKSPLVPAFPSPVCEPLSDRARLG